MKTKCYMANININMIEEDFDNLCHTSMKWDQSWERQKRRFDPEPMFHWKYAYWADTYVNVMFMRAFLTTQNQETQTVFDTAINSYLVLTNWSSANWRD